jgi:heat shock 70kDa protein 1/2/6/8
VKIDETVVSPVQVASLIIGKLKDQAEEWLSRPNHRSFVKMHSLPKNEQNKVIVNRCVIGVPVYFNEQQRCATKQAAIHAGFVDVTLLPESTAAALAYGLFIAGQKTVLVFDPGGGTTDVTLV